MRPFSGFARSFFPTLPPAFSPPLPPFARLLLLAVPRRFIFVHIKYTQYLQKFVVLII